MSAAEPICLGGGIALNGSDDDGGSMATFIEGDVHANGINLRYHRTGGAKPPLLLAHGVTDLGLVWTRVARVLEATYDVIMVDARGHGGSDTPAGGYAAADHAADLAGVIEALGLSEVRVLGHSMGAGAATVLAATRPELVSRLVLEDPSWRGAPRLDEDIAEWRRGLASQQALGREELMAAGHRDHPDWHESEFGPWADGKLQARFEIFEVFRDPDGGWRDQVSRIVCPTLLIRGDVAAGGIISEEQAAEAVALNPAVEVAHIAGAGHSIRRTHFAEYMEAVTGFLSRAGGRATP